MPITVLDPTVGPVVREFKRAPSLDTVAGKTIALLDNSKPKADIFLLELAEVLRSRFGVGDVLMVSKTPSSKIAPVTTLDDIAAKAHGIITGIGDWGSCSSCSVHDGIEMEKRGVRSAVVLTEPFSATGELTAKMAGIPGFPFVVMPHPVSRLDRAALRDRAESYAAALVGLLTDPSR